MCASVQHMRSANEFLNEYCHKLENQIYNTIIVTFNQLTRANTSQNAISSQNI